MEKENLEALSEQRCRGCSCYLHFSVVETQKASFYPLCLNCQDSIEVQRQNPMIDQRALETRLLTEAIKKLTEVLKKKIN